MFDAYERLTLNTKVLYYSMDMSREQIEERILTISSCSGREKLTESGDICNPGLMINDKAFITVEEIEKEAAGYFDNAGGVVIIDYLQLMSLQSPANNDRKTEFCGILKSLKLCAKKHNMAILVLSQVGRVPEYRKNHRPLLDAKDLPDTFEAFKNADTVVFLFREHYYDLNTADEEMEIILSKHPAAESAVIRVGWDTDRRRIYDIKEEYS